jgi:hypothetical protein
MRLRGDLEAEPLIKGVGSGKWGLEVTERGRRISLLENGREQLRADALALKARVDADEREAVGITQARAMKLY